jgi:hypothetical protein
VSNHTQHEEGERDLARRDRFRALWLVRSRWRVTEANELDVEVQQIDDFRPAFHFNLIASPNEWRNERRNVATGAKTGHGKAYRAFCQTLIDELCDKHYFTKTRAA